MPGIQVAVLHEDRLVLSSAHGHADVESGVALTTSHLFRIASHSKTFTATAVLQLVEDGRLRLDDPLADHLDFLEGAPAGRVTVREVLAHGSGLVRDGWDGDFWQLFRSFPDRADLERISVDAADVLGRNERFKYSNIGFGLLGLVIEAVTGSPYEAHIAARITGPLGLADTGPELDPARAGEVATGYGSLAYLDRRAPHRDGRRRAPSPRPPASTRPPRMSSATRRPTSTATSACSPTTRSGWRSATSGRSRAARRGGTTGSASP